MIALAGVFVIVLLSLLVTRVATVALTLTGMSLDDARFQARSALTGVGFTTSDAESMVRHPARRRVVMLLMLVGSAGVVTTIATLMLSFVGTDRGEALLRLGVLILGLLGVLFAARSRWVDRALRRVIKRLLRRWTVLDTHDFAELLHVAGGFSVLQVGVRPDSWLAGHSFGDLDLRAEGIATLGLERSDGHYIGAPVRETQIRAGDTLILYGNREHLRELDERRADRAGDEAHERAVAEQRALNEAERESMDAAAEA